MNGFVRDRRVDDQDANPERMDTIKDKFKDNPNEPIDEAHQHSESEQPMEEE